MILLKLRDSSYYKNKKTTLSKADFAVFDQLAIEVDQILTSVEFKIVKFYDERFLRFMQMKNCSNLVPEKKNQIIKEVSNYIQYEISKRNNTQDKDFLGQFEKAFELSLRKDKYMVCTKATDHNGSYQKSLRFVDEKTSYL